MVCNLKLQLEYKQNWKSYMGIELNERFILKESGDKNVYLSKMFRMFR